MISKLVVWGPTRDQAIRRMKRALREYKVEGTISNIDFHKELLEHPPYVEGTYNTRVLDEKPVEKPALDAFRDEAKLAALLAKLRKDEQLRSGPTSDHQTNQDRKISNWRKYGRFKQLGSGWQ
jgi:acetyl-CoA carboxylase biotin carboxylase subunit